MTRLPFKTLPKDTEKYVVGNDETGTLEIAKIYDLSPNERIYIKQEMESYPDLRSSAVKMARAIATKSGMKLLDVYNALTNGNTETLGEYLEEFVDFQELMDNVSSQRRLVLATAILKYRVVADWQLQNTGDANLIHPLLVGMVADFAGREESGWAEAVEAITEEDLGKSETAAA